MVLIKELERLNYSIHSNGYKDDCITKAIAEIKQLRASVKQLEAKSINDSWDRNPDRSGGQYTEEEINRSTEWR